MDGELMSFFKNFITGEYAIGYRFVPENGKLLFQNEKTAFQIIPSSKHCWYADPMLFEFKGRQYLFFEAYDKKVHLGRIACCELKRDGTCSEIKTVISEEFHLSYPDVFRFNGRIVMIPETASLNQILLYECIEFPGKWQKAAVLLDDIKTVDSTVFEFDGKHWLFSAEVNDSVLHGSNLNVYEFKDGFELIPHPANPAVKDISVSRPAGNIFRFKGDILRPSQDCSVGDYGRALKFNRIIELNSTEYREDTVFTVSPQNIQTDLGKKLSGCHTYALSEDKLVEVVDVKYNKIDIVLGIKINIYNALKKLKLLK